MNWSLKDLSLMYHVNCRSVIQQKFIECGSNFRTNNFSCKQKYLRLWKEEIREEKKNVSTSMF